MQVLSSNCTRWNFNNLLQDFGTSLQQSQCICHNVEKNLHTVHKLHTHSQINTHTDSHLCIHTDQYLWQPTAKVRSQYKLILTCMNSNTRSHVLLCNHTIAVHREACSHSLLMEYTAGYNNMSSQETLNSWLYLNIRLSSNLCTSDVTATWVFGKVW